MESVGSAQQQRNVAALFSKAAYLLRGASMRAAQHLTETHLEAQGFEKHRWTRGARNVPEDNFRDTRMHCQHR
jgi:hypothetical protein